FTVGSNLSIRPRVSVSASTGEACPEAKSAESSVAVISPRSVCAMRIADIVSSLRGQSVKAAANRGEQFVDLLCGDDQWRAEAERVADRAADRSLFLQDLLRPRTGRTCHIPGTQFQRPDQTHSARSRRRRMGCQPLQMT